MRSPFTFVTPRIEIPLTVSEEFVQLLIVENPAQFYYFVLQFINYFETGEGEFTALKDGEQADAFKCGEIVSDWFGFGLNDKKLLSALYKRLESLSFNAENSKIFHELTAKTTEFLENLSMEVPVALHYNEAKPTDYFKIIGLKFEESYESLEEKIIVYINSLIGLKHCEFFVFVNLKSVLDDEKLKLLYKHCQSEKVGLLLLESSKIRQLLPNEKAVIITEDLCEIVENY